MSSGTIKVFSPSSPTNAAKPRLGWHRPWVRFLLLVVTLSLSACGEDQQPAEAVAFWERIQAEDYRSWMVAPGYEERVPSRAAHGDAVDVFINDVVETALADETTNVWPVGSIIVKDGYEGGDLQFIAGMEKLESGEWFWVEYNEDGDTLYSGAPTLCTGCHEIGDDGVRSFFLPN